MLSNFRAVTFFHGNLTPPRNFHTWYEVNVYLVSFQRLPSCSQLFRIAILPYRITKTQLGRQTGCITNAIVDWSAFINFQQP